MKKVIKVLITILLICVLIIGGFIWLLVGSYDRVKTDIDQYETDLQKIKNAAKLMPTLDSLNGYTDIEYTYKIKCYSTLAGFYSDAFALFVTYDQNQYITQKEKFYRSISFLKNLLCGYPIPMNCL